MINCLIGNYYDDILALTEDCVPSVAADSKCETDGLALKTSNALLCWCFCIQCIL